MIHCIYSNLPKFKTVEFHRGLNVLIVRREQESTEKQTRNRAGKTSLIEIVHLLTGADIKKDSPFRSDKLSEAMFGMEFDLGGSKTKVERKTKKNTKIVMQDYDRDRKEKELSHKHWLQILGDCLFDLGTTSDGQGNPPTFRSLFPYFVRRQNSGGFSSPEKQANMQQVGDFQKALMFLLGLDWTIASDWQQVRNREKTLKELKKAAGIGAFGNIIGKASDLRTQLAVAEANLKKLRNQVDSFKVHAEYSELETEADKITSKMNILSNENTIDIAVIRDIEKALQSEHPPTLSNLEEIYAEVGVSLPQVATKRYEEVRSFHESVIRNRRDYLSEELNSAKQRVEIRNESKAKLDQKRSEVMGILQSHGALEQFSKLQAKIIKLETDVEVLRQRFQAAEQLEGSKTELEIERNRLTLRLRRDFTEQKQRLDEAILAFEEISKRLYESAGSMTVEATSNGPLFEFPMQGSSSKGIRNIQIFCFDMMLMRVCNKRGFGTEFLIHDSHLFDGVDGRQVISALKVGSQIADELGFQYIVTLNEDDAFKESADGFDIREHILPVTLTDATEDGGLFGFRF